MMVKCMDEQSHRRPGPSFSTAELLWHCLSLKTFRISVELFCPTVLYENGLNLKNFGIRAELRVSLRMRPVYFSGRLGSLLFSLSAPQLRP